MMACSEVGGPATHFGGPGARRRVGCSCSWSSPRSCLGCLDRQALLTPTIPPCMSLTIILVWYQPAPCSSHLISWLTPSGYAPRHGPVPARATLSTSTDPPRPLLTLYLTYVSPYMYISLSARPLWAVSMLVFFLCSPMHTPTRPITPLTRLTVLKPTMYSCCPY